MTVDRRILNAPLVVLAGYLALAVLPIEALRPWLAVLLGLFGSGASTVAVLYPRRGSLDGVEWMALSGLLSIALGGMFGFALARSVWGLRAGPFIITAVGFNLICYGVFVLRLHSLEVSERVLRLDGAGAALARAAGAGWVSRGMTAALLAVFLVSAAGVVVQIEKPASDPPLTEFFLLNGRGQLGGYPRALPPGGKLDMAIAVSNWEHRPAAYQVKGFIAGQEVGRSSEFVVAPQETISQTITLHIPSQISGPTRVEWILEMDAVPHRYLHLWMAAPVAHE